MLQVHACMPAVDGPHQAPGAGTVFVLVFVCVCAWPGGISVFKREKANL